MLRSGQTPGYKPTHGSSQSSVGNRSLYEAGDQRIEPQSAINERDRYKEGVKNSHQNLDAKDERSIANKVANQGKQSDSSHHHHHISDPETEMSKQDPTKPAKMHGNTPSKGARIDAELKVDDEQRLREKGIK